MNKAMGTMAFMLTTPGMESSPDWFFVGHNGECVASMEDEKLSKFMTFDHMLSQYDVDLDDYDTPITGVWPPWI